MPDILIRCAVILTVAYSVSVLVTVVKTALEWHVFTMQRRAAQAQFQAQARAAQQAAAQGGAKGKAGRERPAKDYPH